MRVIKINGEKICSEKTQNISGKREGIGYNKDGFPVKFWEGYGIETCGLDDEFLIKTRKYWRVWIVAGNVLGKMVWAKANWQVYVSPRCLSPNRHKS